MRITTRITAALLAASLGATATACGQDGKPSEETVMVNTGSADDALREYDAVLAEAREAIDAALGDTVPEWEIQPSDAGGAFCPDGETVTAYSDLSLTRDATVEQDEQVFAAVEPVLTKAGFTNVGEWVRSDNSVEYRGVDEHEGTFFLFLNRKVVSMSVQTGCYPPEPKEDDGGRGY